jgi:uncharacterized membrane protein
LLNLKDQGVKMRLTRPKKIVFIISLILVIISLVAHFNNIQFATEYQYWIMLVGYVLLAAGVAFKGF